MPESPTKRLFFALNPPAAVRQEISQSVSSTLSRPVKQVPIDNLHLTLVFMGTSTVSQQSDYLAIASTLTVEPFTVVLDYLDQFSRAKILWLGARQVPENLMRLHERLSTALQSVGFEPPQQTYCPHVTLARQFRGQTPVYGSRIVWDVRSFSLMESRSTQQGVRYIELQRWPLE